MCHIYLTTLITLPHVSLVFFVVEKYIILFIVKSGKPALMPFALDAMFLFNENSLQNLLAPGQELLPTS